MKKLILYTVSIFIYFPVFCQIIPNASFEEWEVVNGFERPVDWAVFIDSIHQGVQKGTESFEGDYSLFLTPHYVFSTWGYTCESVAFINLKLDAPLGENKSFYFFVKSIADTTFLYHDLYGDPYFQLTVGMYEGDNYLGFDKFSLLGEIPEFELIELPLTFSEADSIRIRIQGGETDTGADGCGNFTFSWVDGLYVDDSMPTALNEVDEDLDYQISPNPSNGLLNIKGDLTKIESYTVFNILGQELERGKVSASQIKINSKGNLILVLENRGNRRVIKRLMIF